MACPHVSATVVLIQTLRISSGSSKLLPSEVAQVLRHTALDKGNEGYDSIYGYGIVNAYSAVASVLS